MNTIGNNNLINTQYSGQESTASRSQANDGSANSTGGISRPGEQVEPRLPPGYRETLANNPAFRSIQPPSYAPYNSNTPRTIRVDGDDGKGGSLPNYVTRDGESSVKVYQPKWYIDGAGNKIYRTPDELQPPEIKGFELSSGKMMGDHATYQYVKLAPGAGEDDSLPRPGNELWKQSPDGIATGTGFKRSGDGGYERDLTVLVPPSEYAQKHYDKYNPPATDGTGARSDADGGEVVDGKGKAPAPGTQGFTPVNGGDGQSSVDSADLGKNKNYDATHDPNQLFKNPGSNQVHVSDGSGNVT